MSVEPAKLFETLKATVFKNATNEELLALVVVSNTYGLNPLLREIYAFPAKGGGIVPVVSVDGWNTMLIRQPDFDGIEFEFSDDQEGNVASCTATIHIKNRTHPVKITEYFAECTRNTEPWKTMPRRMLRNRTLCQASRVAFGFSGVYHEDEATTITVDATVTPTEPPPKLVAAPKGEAAPTPQTELEALVLTNGYTLEHLLKFGAETQNISEPEGIKSFADIKTDEAKRLVRGSKALLGALKNIKEAPAQ